MNTSFQRAEYLQALSKGFTLPIGTNSLNGYENFELR